MMPPRPAPARRSPRVAFAGLALVAVAFVGCFERLPRDVGSLSCLLERERWVATTVSAKLSRADSESAPFTLSIDARRDPGRERLTFLVHGDTVVGTHEVRVFGALVGLDPGGGPKPYPVANACARGDPTSVSGTLTIEVHDPEARTLGGSFTAQVCDVKDPSNAQTLADGRFEGLRY